ncbi:hypothetical protein N7470_003663 [Penicillium chermesinum]|nr:hypothetical protein N7470_003663 [Penicillium chermesinum]
MTWTFCKPAIALLWCRKHGTPTSIIPTPCMKNGSGINLMDDQKTPHISQGSEPRFDHYFMEKMTVLAYLLLFPGS